MKLIPKQQKRGADEPLEPWVPFDFIEEGPSGATYYGPRSEYGGYVQGSVMAPGGTRFFVYEELITPSVDGDDGNLHVIELGTPYDFGTVTTELAARIGNLAQDINFSNDGLHMYALTWTQTDVGATIIQYDLSTAWDVFTKTEMGTFIIPDIVQGYTRTFMRTMDISEDGRQIYLFDPVMVLLVNNPDGLRGAFITYELTTPYDITTAVEHSVFVLTDELIEGRIVTDMTVWSRGHHVDQIAVAGSRMVNFNFPNGLVDKYVRDGGRGNVGGAEAYISTRVAKYDRGWTTRSGQEESVYDKYYSVRLYNTKPG